MRVATEKLLSICGNAISSSKNSKDLSSLYNHALVSELMELLDSKNGFYGFESALHVYPFEQTGSEIGLVEWNKHNLWIAEYKGLASDGVYFAEDIFGGQFSIRNDGVYSFEPETGVNEKLTDCLDDWCKLILEDYDFLTGYSLSHAWQKKNGRIPTGYRLIPKIPFVTGGEYDVDNLYLEKSDIALRLRATIALQIKDLNDGERVKINLK